MLFFFRVSSPGLPHGVIILDTAISDFKAIQEEPRPCMKGLYYILEACYPQFQAIRKGHIEVSEHDGLSMLDHLRHVPVFTRISTELWAHYPAHWQSLQSFNSCTATHLAYNMCKPFLTNNFKEKFVFGKYYDRLHSHLCIFVLNLQIFLNPYFWHNVESS